MDGIESEVFKILKVQYGTKLQAYHEGTMRGKGIQKVMSNGTQIFAVFAAILKENKRPDSKFDTEEKLITFVIILQIVLLYGMEHSLLQGKFAPSEDDVIQYKRFVTAAVLSYVDLGCNVTPKVHMM